MNRPLYTLRAVDLSDGYNKTLDIKRSFIPLNFFQVHAGGDVALNPVVGATWDLRDASGVSVPRKFRAVSAWFLAGRSAFLEAVDLSDVELPGGIYTLYNSLNYGGVFTYLTRNF